MQKQIPGFTKTRENSSWQPASKSGMHSAPGVSLGAGTNQASILPHSPRAVPDGLVFQAVPYLVEGSGSDGHQRCSQCSGFHLQAPYCRGHTHLFQLVPPLCLLVQIPADLTNGPAPSGMPLSVSLSS